MNSTEASPRRTSGAHRQSLNKLETLRYLRHENREIEDKTMRELFVIMKDKIDKIIFTRSEMKECEEMTICGLPSDPNKKEDITKLLQCLANLGKYAQLDLELLQDNSSGDSNQNSPDSFTSDDIAMHSLSDLSLKQPEQIASKSPNALFTFHMPHLEEERLGKDFLDILKNCQASIESLKQGDCTLERMRSLLDNEKKMMEKLRRHKALCAVKLDRVIFDDSTLNTQLHILFEETLTLIGVHFSVQKLQLIQEVLSCAWVCLQGVPPCVLSGSDLRDVRFMLYGLEAAVCRVKPEATMFLMKNDFVPLIEMKDVEVYPKAGQGFEVAAKPLRDIRGKRKSCEKPTLYRVGCEVVFQVYGVNMYLKCSSSVFTIRTGSPQLWPFTSYVIWDIWTSDDGRQCPTSIPLDSVLSLLEALMFGSGLDQSYVQDGVANRRKLTDGERQGWLSTLKDKYNKSKGKNLQEISKTEFTKTRKQKIQNEPKQNIQNEQKTSQDLSYCLWAHMVGTVNTALRLKECRLDRFYNMGLTHKLLESAPLTRGDLVIRSGHTGLCCSSGKEPLAKIILEVGTGIGIGPLPYEVSSFKECSLEDICHNIYIDNKPDLVQRIFPTETEVEDISTVDTYELVAYTEGKGNTAYQKPCPPKYEIWTEGQSTTAKTITLVSQDCHVESSGSKQQRVECHRDIQPDSIPATVKEALRRDDFPAQSLTSDERGALAEIRHSVSINIPVQPLTPSTGREGLDVVSLPTGNQTYDLPPTMSAPNAEVLNSEVITILEQPRSTSDKDRGGTDAIDLPTGNQAYDLSPTMTAPNAEDLDSAIEFFEQLQSQSPGTDGFMESMDTVGPENWSVENLMPRCLHLD